MPGHLALRDLAGGDQELHHAVIAGAPHHASVTEMIEAGVAAMGPYDVVGVDAQQHQGGAHAGMAFLDLLQTADTGVGLAHCFLETVLESWIRTRLQGGQARLHRDLRRARPATVAAEPVSQGPEPLAAVRDPGPVLVVVAGAAGAEGCAGEHEAVAQLHSRQRRGCTLGEWPGCRAAHGLKSMRHWMRLRWRTPSTV